MAWPSNFVFDGEIRDENIYVPIQFQCHKAKVKVTAAKNSGAQVCAPVGHIYIT